MFIFSNVLTVPPRSAPCSFSMKLELPCKQAHQSRLLQSVLLWLIGRIIPSGPVTGLKSIMDALPGLPELAAHLQSAAWLMTQLCFDSSQRHHLAQLNTCACWGMLKVSYKIDNRIIDSKRGGEKERRK